MKLSSFTGVVGKSVQDAAVRALVMQELLAAAPILNYAEFYKILGASDKPLKNASVTSGVASRAIGVDYTPISAEPSYGDITLKTFGGTIQTDKAYERQQPGGTASEHIRQVLEFAKAAGRLFTDKLFNGDSEDTATEFDGLKILTPLSQTIKFDTENGGAVPFGTTTANIAQQKKFLEALDNLIASVSGGAAILAMDAKTISRLRTIGRDFVQTVSVQNAMSGAVTNLTMYNEIPILSTGFSINNSSKVIGHAETCGTSTTCTSIYAIKFGEKSDVACATNVGVQVESMPEANWLKTRLEFDAGLEVLNDKSIARLMGVIID